MFSQAISKLGGIDILVNNTGISGPTVAADELSFEDWNTVINLNLNSTFFNYPVSHSLFKASTGRRDY